METARRSASRYAAPRAVQKVALGELLTHCGRTALTPRQADFLGGPGREPHVYCAGDLSILQRPSVSIVGTRDISPEGAARARRLARDLASVGATVVSGLARGVDTEALTSAIAAGGQTCAVIGTPLEKAYPAENARLQEEIYTDHLLLSPFAPGEQTFKANFPKRNRVMAALSDATVIVEASDTSGTLHQAAECVRLDRWLFIMSAIQREGRVSWPSKFIGSPKVAWMSSTQDVLDAIGYERA